MLRGAKRHYEMFHGATRCRRRANTKSQMIQSKHSITCLTESSWSLCWISLKCDLLKTVFLVTQNAPCAWVLLRSTCPSHWRFTHMLYTKWGIDIILLYMEHIFSVLYNMKNAKILWKKHVYCCYVGMSRSIWNPMPKFLRLGALNTLCEDEDRGIFSNAQGAFWSLLCFHYLTVRNFCIS